MIFVCFFKQKTAYEVRISDWSSDVCSSDLVLLVARPAQAEGQVEPIGGMPDHVAEHRVCPGVTGVDELLVPAVPHQAQRDSVGCGHVAAEVEQPALRVDEWWTAPAEARHLRGDADGAGGDPVGRGGVHHTVAGAG